MVVRFLNSYQFNLNNRLFSRCNRSLHIAFFYLSKNDLINFWRFGRMPISLIARNLVRKTGKLLKTIGWRKGNQPQNFSTLENLYYYLDIFHYHSDIFHYYAENTFGHKFDNLCKNDLVVWYEISWPMTINFLCLSFLWNNWKWHCGQKEAKCVRPTYAMQNRFICECSRSQIGTFIHLIIWLQCQLWPQNEPVLRQNQPWNSV
jgi:hypothetical protein